MANTYAFAIFGALLLAVTLAPVLCSFLFHNKTEEKDTFVDRLMKRRYLHDARTGCCDYRYLTLGGDGRRCWPSRSRWSRAWAASSCPRSRRGTSGSGPSCPGPSRSRRPRGWRPGSAR